MNARQLIHMTLLSLPGFVDHGEWWEIRKSRARRRAYQTEDQQFAALARAEAKRARRRERNLRGAA